MLKQFKEIEFLNYCIICGSNSFVNFQKAIVLLGLKDPFKVVRCSNCDLSWLNPRPTKEGYKKLYSGNVYFTQSNEIPEDYELYASQRIPHFVYRVKRLKSLFPDQEIQLLDIGSATGEFVGICREYGIKAFGLEISSYATDIAKKKFGNYFYNGDLDSLPSFLQNRKFNIVHLNHTFEHFLDPIDSLKRINKILDEDGILVIEVPYQIENIIEKFKLILGRSKPKKFDLFSLHHPFFYTPRSISTLLKKHNFSIISLRTYLPTTIVKSELLFGETIKRILLKIGDIFFKNGDIIEIIARKKV